MENKKTQQKKSTITKQKKSTINKGKGNEKSKIEKGKKNSEKNYILQIEKYYYFKVKFKKEIFSNSNTIPKESDYCIVSDAWLKTWKKYVNYKDSKFLIFQNLDASHEIIEDFIKNNPNNPKPGKIDSEFKGQTTKEILENLNQNKNINFVSKDFYELFPHDNKIDSIMCKGIGINFKFVVSNEIGEKGKFIVVDYAPNLDGSKGNKCVFEISNKSKEDIIKMPLMELRDPNNKDVKLKFMKINNNNINNNQANKPIQVVNPQQFKQSLPKQVIENVKDTTMVGLIMPEEIKKLNNKPVGLNNIGSTCYMNSTIQCFSNVGPLTKYLLKKENKEKLQKEKEQKLNKLTPYFADVINHLWDTNNKQNGFSPYEFKKKLGELNPLFEGFKAGDSKDLINFLIMQMHEELNKVKVPNNNNNRINQIPLNQSDEKVMLNSFIEEYTKLNRSKISDLFYFMTKNKLICGNCHIINYNFGIAFFIIFPLEKIRQFKANFFGPNINVVNIYECLTHEQNPTILDDFYCNNCKKTTKCMQISTFYTLPPYLIIILNRGKGNMYNVGFYIEEYIKLQNFAEFDKENCSYYLNSVIVHLGPSGESGHFIAYCVSPIDHKWYLYNDSIVTLCDQNNIGQQINQRGIPYILFYKKCIDGN